MSDGVRLDKWLWAARFFKTRSLAVKAIDAGHIILNGERAKPARILKCADQLRIYTPHGDFEVAILLLSEQRRSAEIAQTLYAETEESKTKRAREQFAKSLQPQFNHPHIKGRPTKKWRRQLSTFEQSDA